MLLLILLFCFVRGQGFDVKKATGHWYQVADVPQFYEMKYSSCTTATYEFIATNHTIGIVNRAYDKKSQTACSVYGNGVPTPGAENIWNLELYGSSCNSFPFLPISSQLVWQNVLGQHQYQLAQLTGPGNAFYILSRKPSLSPRLWEALFATFPNLVPTDQSNC